METHRFSVPADVDQDDWITLEGWTPRRGSLTLKRQRPTQVQQESTATLPTDIDLIRPVQASDLRQRPRSTSLQLVHTEVITSHPTRPVSSLTARAAFSLFGESGRSPMTETCSSEHHHRMSAPFSRTNLSRDGGHATLP